MELENLKTEFVEYLRQGSKPRVLWRVGVEIEFFGYDAQTRRRLDNRQVQAVFRELADSNDNLVFDDDIIVGANNENGGRWTVEPGGQIEFSSDPRLTLLEIEQDLRAAFAQLQYAGAKLNFTFLAIGFDPLRTIDEQNWFLKPRFKLMKSYFQTRGQRAWDMMTRTCSVQINLDYADENDLIKKFIVGNRLAPTVAAIFGNSPFADGAASGFKSTRAAAWLETDPNRCGVSPLALQKEFSLADFIEYTLDVPMLFAKENGADAPGFTGQPFRNFLINAQSSTVTDWQTHLTTIFTEVRLKNYLEFRAADAGSLEHALAVAALWKGLLYNQDSLDKALELTPQLTAQEFVELQKTVAINGLQAVFGGINILSLAKQIVQLAVEGLERTAPEETKFLDTLRQRVLKAEKSPADMLLENWNGSIEKVFEMTTT